MASAKIPPQSTSKSRRIRMGTASGSEDIHFGAGSSSLSFVRSDAATMEGSESVLPSAFRNRLYGLFNQIEQEFEALYSENLQCNPHLYFSISNDFQNFVLKTVQEKLESLPCRHDREFFLGDRPGLDQTDFDSFFTKHLLKQKCKQDYFTFNNFNHIDLLYI